MDGLQPGTNRRDFLKATGLGVLGTVVIGSLGGSLGRGVGSASAATTTLAFAATDGYITVPGREHAGHPELDPLYIFGFIPVSPTATVSSLIATYKGHAQTSAPHLDLRQEDDIRITLTNLGLVQRPDLTDSHTIHWHGFDVPSPLNDGVPEVSVAVPISKQLTYFYRPHREGTYMYHCHFEDVEHVQMGMTGPLFVRPRQNGTVLGGFNKFAYNDGDGSTGYDREFALLLTEMYLESHWQDAHIQQPLWDQYRADAWFINGRSYPDTLEPSTGFYGPTGSRPTGVAVGDPNPWPNPRVSAPPRLSHQPLSSLVSCNAGDRVLLRMANLGYQLHAMTVPGLVLDVIGKDATLLANGAVKTSMQTETISIGPGESFDCLFTAPSVTQTTTYVLYNRAYATSQNRDQQGIGGMRTEIRVHPAGSLPAQTAPNA